MNIVSFSYFLHDQPFESIKFKTLNNFNLFTTKEYLIQQDGATYVLYKERSNVLNALFGNNT